MIQEKNDSLKLRIVMKNHPNYSVDEDKRDKEKKTLTIVKKNGWTKI